MGNQFFANFDQIAYNGQKCVNLLARPKVLKRVESNPYAYRPYTYKDNDRPDTIARGYYKDPFYAWLVYLSNNTIDPYYDVAMSQDKFQEFIQNKYGSFAAANRKVIAYRVNWDEDPSVIPVNTFDAFPDNIKKYWSPMFDNALHIISYQRANVEWISTTNYYQNVTLSSNSVFAVGDVVSLYQGVNETGSAEVYSVDTGSLILQHVQGNAANLTSIVADSGNSSSVLNSVTLGYSIPLSELAYWSPWTAYEFESEKDAKNKHVKLLDSAYAVQALVDLQKMKV